MSQRTPSRGSGVECETHSMWNRCWRADDFLTFFLVLFPFFFVIQVYASFFILPFSLLRLFPSSKVYDIVWVSIRMNERWKTRGEQILFTGDFFCTILLRFLGTFAPAVVLIFYTMSGNNEGLVSRHGWGFKLKGIYLYTSKGGYAVRSKGLLFRYQSECTSGLENKAQR